MSDLPARIDSKSGAVVHGSPGANPRQRGTLRMAAPFLAGAFVAGWLVRVALPSPALPSRWAGLGLVLLATAMAALALHMRRRRLDYLRGARGEEETARVLAGLPRGAHVFHGLTIPGGGMAAGDIDHVAVSPSGVFAVETLNWSGRATISEGRLLYDGAEPDRNPVDRVRKAAAALRDRLQASGISVPVQPVLCLPRPALEKDAEGVAGVIVCRQTALPGILCESSDPTLDAATVARIAGLLKPLTEE